jgi:hemoglobin/transferrin/lactoferrin receptor protein
MRSATAGCIAMLLTGATLAADAAGDRSIVARAPIDFGTLTVIANKTPQPVSDVTGTVTLLDEEELQRQLVQDIKDIVRYEPGVSAGFDAGRFALSGFTVRGLGGNRVVIEVDGVAVSDRFAVGSFSDAGRNLVDPEVLKRVEILRGPASAIYGSDALAGVVTFTTKDPGDYLDVFGRAAYGGLKAGYNSDDASRVATLTGAIGGKDLQGLVVYSRRDGSELDNRADDAGSQPNPMEWSSDNALAKLVYDNGASGQFRIIVDGSSSERRTDVRSGLGVRDLTPFTGVPTIVDTTLLTGDDEQSRTRISLDHEFSRGISLFDSGVWRVYSQNSETEQFTREQRTTTVFGSPSRAERQRVFEFSQELLGAEAVLRKHVGAGALRHDLVYGLELESSRIEEMRDGVEINLGTGAVTNVVASEAMPVRDFPNTDTFQAGVFVQDDVRFGDSRLTLVPALRYEYYELEPDPDAIFLEDNPAVTSAGVTESDLSPKLGLLYDINDAVSAFAQYAHGFRSPPFEDVNFGLALLQFNTVAIPNPDLKPETSETIELGLRAASERAQGHVSVFYSEYDNFIESKVNLGVDPETGQLTFQSQNRAEARIYGVEAKAVVDLDALADGLWLKAALAYARGDDVERDQPLNTVDPAKAVIGVEYEAPGGRWGAEVVTTLVAAKRRVDESGPELFRAPGYATVDLLGFYRLSRNVRLNWGVFNITDRKFWDWADVRGLEADEPLIDLYTRPGANASVSLSARW